MALVAACASRGGRSPESGEAFGSLTETQKALEDGRSALGKTQEALSHLSWGGDVPASYRQLKSATANFRAQGTAIHDLGQEMRDRGQTYLASWQKEAVLVQDVSLKTSADQRRRAVVNGYDRISASARATRDAWRPYDEALQDIERTLAFDRTLAGLKAAGPTIQKAFADGETLNERLDGLTAEIARLRRGETLPPP